MHKIVLALSICALIPAVCVAVARADDGEFASGVVDRGVVKRVNCDDIKAEMDKLATVSELDEVQVATLSSLKSEWRSNCVKKVGGRSIGRPKVTVNEIAETDVKDNSVCENPDENGCCPGETYKDLGDLGFNCCTENNEKCFPPMAIEKDFSLCDDGTNPDDKGCCVGETYTDLGDLGFNCCEADGVTCFPPIKK